MLDDTYSSYYSSDDNDNGGSKTCYMNRPEYSEGELQSVEKKHKHFTSRSVDNFTNK